MTKVIKKGLNKKVERFNPWKINNSIIRAGKEAGLTKSKINLLLREVGQPVIMITEGKKTVKSTDLRKSILGRLNRRNKKIVRAWKNYDKKK